MATAAPQRRWQAACPNCGGPVEFASAASASTVCGYCRATLLREGEALRKIGQSAELFEDYSPLQPGASGRYQGQAFRVLGRHQLRTEEASWNEWHVLFEDSGRSAWLSEDNGAFVISFEAPFSSPVPVPASAVVGQDLQLEGQRWQLASKVQATIAAAQGELPRPPQLQHGFWVLDLRNTQGEVATLEYSQPGPPLWSIGRSVRLADLAMSGLREDSSKTLGSRSLPCPSCGAALEPRLDNSKSIVCGQCKAVVDISEGVGKDISHFAQDNGMEPLIPLGRIGMFAVSGGSPLPWQAVGYMERCDLPASSEDEQSFWREYLLFNRTEGFVFLVDTEEGWSVVRPITGVPQPAAGGAMRYQDKLFKKRWTYTAKVTYVLGEFYWRVQREERALVTDYEYRNGSRTELLSREQSGQEVTYSHGRALDAAEVIKAFSLPAAEAVRFSRDAGTGAATGGSRALFTKIGIGLFLLIVFVPMLRACARDDCQGYKDNFGADSAEYQECTRRSHGSGVGYGSGGGSYGGYSSGGGGHK